MINHFNAKIAVQHSINTAIFLQQLSQWTFLNLANRHNIYDGLCWSFNTLEAYEEIFPYWSKRQLETLINNAVKEGLIVKGNYNKHKYDRTCWYALTHAGLSFFPELTSEKHLQTLSDSISPNCEMYDHSLSKDENVKKHFTDLCQAFHIIVTPIPTINSTKNISKDILGNLEEDKSLSKQTAPAKSSKTNSSEAYDLSKLMADNPHDIDEQMLADWLDVRKTKKNKVTHTAWKRISRTLVQIEKEAGISPKVAFETMVANAWQSLEVKYFLDKPLHAAKGSDFPAYE